MVANVLDGNGSKKAIGLHQQNNHFAHDVSYRKIPKISPSKYKPPKLVTQKTLR